ncbi:MAG: pseudouridine synthase [Bariatricus sp.]
MIRLDKYLADMGMGTRSEIKKAIRQGTVKVDDVTVKQPELKVDTDVQRITMNGREVTYHRLEYYMLNKPAGVVSATKDPKEKTVLDLIKGQKRKDLFPVGRLDKDTVGLLLITNDGDLSHRLLAPGKHVDKVYYARIDGEVNAEDVDAFARGLDIGDEKLTLPARLEILSSGEESEIRVTIQEGRYHQVKRMFESRGKKVVYLRRESMGTLVLDPTLEEGEYRPLTEEELRQLC